MPPTYTTSPTPSTTTTGTQGTTRRRRKQTQPTPDTSNIVVNGQIYKKSSDSAIIQMSLAKRNLNVSSTISANAAGLMLLSELDCGLSTETFDFVLTDDVTETIDNENIMDEERYKTLSPEEIPALQSFTDVNDPFYQLDDELPDKYQVEKAQEEKSQEPSFIRLAAALAAS